MKRLFLQDAWSSDPISSIYEVSEYGFILDSDGNIIRPTGKRTMRPTIYNFSWVAFERLALIMIGKACEKKGQRAPRTGFWSLARLHHLYSRFGGNRLSNILVSPYTNISISEDDKKWVNVIMDHRIDRNLVYSFSEPETIGIIGVQYNEPKSFMLWGPNNIMKWHLHD